MVAYKVVTKDRKSSNATFLGPESKWVLDYPKGEKVEAVEGSVGILAFGKREDASSFKGGHPHGPSLMIVKVEGSKPSTVNVIAGRITERNIGSFYSNKWLDDTWSPPLGTITFESVKVLT